MNQITVPQHWYYNTLSRTTHFIHGRPMKPFFIKIPIFWIWADDLGRWFGQTIWAGKFWGIWGFSANLSAPILVKFIYSEKATKFCEILWPPQNIWTLQWVPCPCFPLINDHFYKKLSLYIQIPNIYLGMGFEFEFGPQRIRDLVIVCP